MKERITVIGNIGQTPRRKATSKGDVVEFSLAHGQRVQAEDGVWKDGETLWYAVSAWDRLGASAVEALQRGHRVIVQGWLDERRWTGDDGVERLSRDLRASAIGRDISQRTSGGQHGGAPAPAAPEAGSPTIDAPAAPAPARSQAASDPQADVARNWGASPQREPLAPAPAGWASAFEPEQDVPF